MRINLSNLSLILYLSLFSILISCRASRTVSSSGTLNAPRNVVPVTTTGSLAENYINKYKGIAINEMNRTGVPASITLAQGMIESNYGRSSLSRGANNHFGIKCYNGWTGPTVFHNDDVKNDCFRSYKSPEESFHDHSEFLRTGSRYSFLFDIPHNDYKGWARGLKKAGYATNPEYANLLIRKIEEQNLDVFDNEYMAVKNGKTKFVTNDTNIYRVDEPAGKPVIAPSETEGVVALVPRILETNRIKYIIVKEGDTREKLEREFQLLKWELPRYNELENDFEPVPGQILYLQPKRDKAEPGKDFYIAGNGDTMYRISQKFGIKMKSVYEMNRMKEGSEPEAGRKIWLRSIKPVN